MKTIRLCLLSFSLLSAFAGCSSGDRQVAGSPRQNVPSAAADPLPAPTPVQNPGRVVHVVVALCDNKYQGIVPVPEAIGNGDDPANNLYWGAGHGVKNFFRKAKDWSLIANRQNPKTAVLERTIFKHKERDVYIVADAYRGREIKKSIVDFLNFAAGKDVEAVDVSAGVKQERLYIGGGADLIAYIGHDGLMDFSLREYPQEADTRKREVIILSCRSKLYFETPLRATGAEPLLWTTDLMAPEAYSLKAALDGWMLNEDGETVRRRAAVAYQKYQKCGWRGALNTFASGW